MNILQSTPVHLSKNQSAYVTFECEDHGTETVDLDSNDTIVFSELLDNGNYMASVTFGSGDLEDSTMHGEVWVDETNTFERVAA